MGAVTSLLWLAGCEPGGVVAADTQRDGRPPDVEINGPEGDVAAGDLVTLSGTVDGGEGAPLYLRLSSHLDGVLLELDAEPGAAWEWSGLLSPGTHAIVAWAETSDGEPVAALTRVDVIAANVRPGCGIVIPHDGDVFASGSMVPFAGWGYDPDGDDVRLLWSSDKAGALFMGEEWSRILPDGEHVITVEGDDLRDGTCSDAVTIHVGA